MHHQCPGLYLSLPLVFVARTIYHVIVMAVSQSQKGSIESDLYKLLKSGVGTDVTFVVGHSLVPAHSFILAARSSVFAAMFRNDMQEASSRHIRITDMREAALRQLLSFIYTDTTPQLETVAGDLLAAAEKYDLPLLKQRCEEQMEWDISVENAADTVTLAVLHRCPGLQSAAVRFIAAHPKVMATEGWERMLQGNTRAAVQISKLVAAQPRSDEFLYLPPIPPELAQETRIVPSELRQTMASNLLEAAQKGAAREVWALLTAGAPKDANYTSGNTALHLAAAKGHATTVKCLIDLGLDVNAVNGRNKTPLHLAAHNGDRDIIWMLVAASAQVNAQDHQGQTPLHVAATRENSRRFKFMPSESKSKEIIGIVKTLLLAGAKNDIRDRNGETPEEVATFFAVSAFRITLNP